MNNKGKNGTDLGGNKAAVRWVFPLQHTVTFVDKEGKMSYPVNKAVLTWEIATACCLVELPDILHLRSSEH